MLRRSGRWKIYIYISVAAIDDYLKLLYYSRGYVNACVSVVSKRLGEDA